MALCFLDRKALPTSAPEVTKLLSIESQCALSESDLGKLSVQSKNSPKKLRAIASTVAAARESLSVGHKSGIELGACDLKEIDKGILRIDNDLMDLDEEAFNPYKQCALSTQIIIQELVDNLLASHALDDGFLATKIKNLRKDYSEQTDIRIAVIGCGLYTQDKTIHLVFAISGIADGKTYRDNFEKTCPTAKLVMQEAIDNPILKKQLLEGSNCTNITIEFVEGISKKFGEILYHESYWPCFEPLVIREGFLKSKAEDSSVKNLGVVAIGIYTKTPFAFTTALPKLRTQIDQQCPRCKANKNKLIGMYNAGKISPTASKIIDAEKENVEPEKNIINLSSKDQQPVKTLFFKLPIPPGEDLKSKLSKRPLPMIFSP